MQDVKFFSGLAATPGAGTQIGSVVLISNLNGTDVWVTSVTLAALGALSANNDDYVQVRLNLGRRSGAALTGVTEVARLTTQVTGGTGNWAPPTSEFFDFPITAPAVVPEGWILEAAFYTFGAGVTVPPIDFLLSALPAAANIFTE